jgi:hypothetical protein
MKRLMQSVTILTFSVSLIISETVTHAEKCIGHRMCVSLFSTIFLETFCSNICLTIYVRDMHRNACRTSREVCITGFIFKQKWNISINFDEIPHYKILCNPLSGSRVVTGV